MKAVKKAFAFYDKIMKKYDPIISKCIHDNISAIAGQSAFFIVLSSVPLLAFCLSILQGLHISASFIEQALQSVFTDVFLTQIKYFLTETYQNTIGISFVSKVAPPKYKGMIMGGWFVATALGNKLVSIPGHMWDMPLPVVWGTLMVICLLAALFIFSIIKKLNRVS